MVPLLARYRQYYEHITLPLGRVCLRLGLMPDTLSYLSLALSVLAGYVIALQQFWWGVGVILLVSFADMLDGATARAGNLTSDYGTVLDHVIDRYAEGCIIGGIVFAGSVAPAWALFALHGMIMASYVRVRVEATGKIGSCNVGFAGRQEKLGLLLLGLLLQPLAPRLPVLEWALIAVGAASHLTAAQRLQFARRALRKQVV
jgi:phosphatidylglycerophosphate synthase